MNSELEKFLPLFKNLDPTDKERVMKFLTIVKFQKGERILKQGDRGKGLYIIEKGSVTAVTHLPGDTDVPLAEISEGEFFGEVALFTADKATSSVFAKTDVRCYFLSRQILNSLHIVDPLFVHRLIQCIVHPMCQRLRSNFDVIGKNLAQLECDYIRSGLSISNLQQGFELKEIESTDKIDVNDPIIKLMLPNLDKTDINAILAHMKVVTAKKYTVLHRRGESDQCCYFILEGAVQGVFDSHSAYTKFSVYGPTEVLGQLEFMDGKESTVTAIVREDVTLLRMDRQQRQLLKESDPHLWHQFYFFLSKKVAEILRRTNLQLLRLRTEVDCV